MPLVEVVLRNRKDAQAVVLRGKLEVVESGEELHCDVESVAAGKSLKVDSHLELAELGK